jgi:hypothetical protein
MSFRLCAAVIVFATLAAAQAPRLGDYRDPAFTYEDGWTILFNGKDLSGWVSVLRMPDGTSRKYAESEIGEQSTFSVRNGMLFTTGDPIGIIRTADVYDNYVFHVEARFHKEGNSGVTVHVVNDVVWPKGIECQMYQAHMGRIFPIRGATLEGGEMIHSAANPPGQWNVFEVYSEEGRLATVLNGKLVGLASNSNPKVGYIGLESEGVPVEFRNIKIKRFTPAHHLRPKEN